MTNLMFHEVYIHNPDESGFTNKETLKFNIPIDHFEKITCHIKENFPNELSITIDDGGVNGVYVISKILLKHQLKAHFFISTQMINNKGFMTSEEIRALHDMGHIIGSHSHSHPLDITRIPLSQQYDEWHQSKMILENITKSVIKTASIPNGIFNKETLEILQSLGYEYIYTSCPTTKIRTYKGLQIYGRFTIDISTIESINPTKPLYSKSKQIILETRYNLLSLARSILGDNYYKIRKIIPHHI